MSHASSSSLKEKKNKIPIKSENKNCPCPERLITIWTLKCKVKCIADGTATESLAGGTA